MKEIQFFFDSENRNYVKSGFYIQDIEDVNGLMFYNLKPGTVSYFKDVIVTSEIAPGFNISQLLKISKFMAVLYLFIEVLLD